ncbi:hypothetical protein BD324DRAFT_652813 [Kockovaella imperatae]|uniref:Uncharacterized protein n=1 Tax=Kockovaella imperatae TaxID=4999 RepID=A0A1Y1UAM6_9TREE|nr:hypothetical protein BD324DRAFT_652813 [Kockovaella imperatae]ORX35098.1 hypothetical protein BD324DRAFT_652813 [Kockovaella imperatae]
MSYVIAGKSIKNEYLALGTILLTGGGAYAYKASQSSKPVVPKPAAASSSSSSNTDSDLGITTDSKDELDFIRQFVADAEKEGKKH